MAAVLSLFVCLSACDKDDEHSVRGEVSPMGEEGAYVDITNFGMFAGRATVVSLDDGISSYTFQGQVPNANLRNILSNRPGVTIDGENVTISDFRVRNTVKGIEVISGLGHPGVIAHYDAKVGDTYSMGGTSRVRTVVSRSIDNDFSWGGMLIRAIQVEEPNRSHGIKKTTYWANHRWGLVGVEFTYEDDSSVYFPLFFNTSN